MFYPKSCGYRLYNECIKSSNIFTLVLLLVLLLSPIFSGLKSCVLPLVQGAYNMIFVKGNTNVGNKKYPAVVAWWSSCGLITVFPLLRWVQISVKYGVLIIQ